MFWGPVHPQFCRRSLSDISYPGPTPGSIRREVRGGLASCCIAADPFLKDRRSRWPSTCVNQRQCEQSALGKRKGRHSHCVCSQLVLHSPEDIFQLTQIVNQKRDLGELDQFLLFLRRFRDLEQQGPSLHGQGGADGDAWAEFMLL